MNAVRPWKKVTTFGLLGAFGCLLGWAFGEGLLAAGMPASSEQEGPSLASRPEAPPPPPAPKADRGVAPPSPAALDTASRAVLPPSPQAPVVGKREPPQPLPEDVQKLLDAAGGKSGELQFTLVWSNRNDLDLHCVDPNGVQISFAMKKAEKSGGHLDVDRNVNGETSTPIENIYFPTGTPPGEYAVYVDYYGRNLFSPDATAYKLHTLIANQRRTFEGTLRYGDAMKLVHKFTLSGERIAAPSEVIVYRGGKNKFKIQVARDPSNKDPIKLTFEGAAPGVKVPADATISDDRDFTEIEVAAEADAKVEASKIKVLAESKSGKLATSLQIAVKLPPPAIHIAGPSEVILFPGGKNKFQVRLERQNSDQPVRISVVGDSSGLTLPAGVTVPGTKNEAEFEVAADPKSAAGSRNVRILAESVHGKVEQECRLTVQIPAATLQVAAAPKIGLQAGGSNVLPIRIARDWFDGPVVVRTVLPSGITTTEATIPAGRDEGELTLSAAETAALGTFPIKLTAEGGGAKGEGSAILELVPVPLPPAAKATWSWRLVLVIGLWTSLLATGLSLALVVGQNRHLGRPWLSGREAGVILVGGGFAGFFAGGIGQALFSLMAVSGVMPEIGFLAGWLLLGGLLGRGVGFFIPNLDPWRSTFAGILGGLLGAGAFILISKFGNVPGRIVGAALLGFCIGMMVALVELAFRRAWLEVRFGGGETITVNLGPEPVKVGGDGRQCAVWARGAEAVALRYWLRDGRVVCDVAGQGERPAANGDRKQAGSVEVIVRRASTGVPVVPQPVLSHFDDDEDPPLPPPKPVSRAVPPRSKAISPPVARPIAPPPPRPVAPSAARPSASPPPSKAVPPPAARSAFTCPECRAGMEKAHGVCPNCGAMN